METLKTKYKTPMGATVSTSPSTLLDVMTARMFGGAVVTSLASGNYSLDSAEFKASLALYTSWFRRGLVADRGGAGSTVLSMLGKSTMYPLTPITYTGTFAIPYTMVVDPSGTLAKDIGFFTFPDIVPGPLTPQRSELMTFRFAGIPTTATLPWLAAEFIEKVYLKDNRYLDAAQLFFPVSRVSAPRRFTDNPQMAAMMDMILETKDIYRGTSELPLSVRYYMDHTLALSTTLPNATLTAEAIDQLVLDGLRKSEGARIAHYSKRVPNPTANPASGNLFSPLLVELSVSLDGSTIYYTLDGSPPTDLSLAYTAPLIFTTPGKVVIRFMAVAGSLQPSERMTAEFEVISASRGSRSLGWSGNVGIAVSMLLILLVLVFVANFFHRRRLRAAKAGAWLIPISEVTIYRDHVLGRGTYGVVYEGTFRGSAVAVKELCISGSASSALATAAKYATSKRHGTNVAPQSMTTAGTFNPPEISPEKARRLKIGVPLENDVLLDPNTTQGRPPAALKKSTRSRRKGKGKYDSGSGGSSSSSSSGGGGGGGSEGGNDGIGGHISHHPHHHRNKNKGKDRAGPLTKTSRIRLTKSFEREASVLASLRHPNCVFMFGAAFEADRPPILVTELMQCSVFELLHNPVVTLTPRRRVEMALDAASGLSYLHSHRPKAILHRDVKSLNLLVDKRSGVVKVSDFGLSSLMGEGGNHSFGTLLWAAPELLGGFAPMAPPDYTAACDVYSFGIVLYELATGREPWDGYALIEVKSMVCAGLRPPMPTDNATGMASIISQCLNADPELRPTMDVVVAELTKLLQAMGGESHASGGSVTNSSAEMERLQLRNFAAPPLVNKLGSPGLGGDPRQPVKLASATVLFACIAEPAAGPLEPEVRDGLYQRAFVLCEAIARVHGLVKVDTIAGGIMLAAGLKPAEREARSSLSHATRACLAALDILSETANLAVDPMNPDLGTVVWRIGVATGPVSATSSEDDGRDSPTFHVLGEVVSLASRLESSSDPGAVQCSVETRAFAIEADGDHSLDFVQRGSVMIKGKGTIETFWARHKHNIPGTIA